jgi:glycosyltransferase involved in cell wall biosynthesis
MNKKVLIIAYHFPPSNAIGGMRPARFAKHLPAFGWDPTVLTVEDRHAESRDNDLLGEVAGIRIVRTRVLPTLQGLYLLLKGRRSASTGRRPVKQAPASTGQVRERPSAAAKRWFISLFLSLPDPEKGWILPAVLRAVREIRGNRIDCMLTTSPPHSVMLAGLLVKKLTGAGWIVDLRDPWSTVVGKTYPQSALSDRIEAVLERCVFRSADLVLCTTERLRDVYRALYAGEGSGKFEALPNGIDSALTRMPHSGKYPRFTVSYTGSLYYGRSPEPLFQALRVLFEQKQMRPDELSIRLVGQCRSAEGRPIEEIVADYGLSGLVEVTDAVPRAQALEIVSRSHVALLLAPDQPYQVPAKVYDYLGVGTPVLAIAAPGATADLVEETGCGKAFHPSDIAGIGKFLLDARRGACCCPEDRAARLARFDAAGLTGELARHLERISSASPRVCRGSRTSPS